MHAKHPSFVNPNNKARSPCLPGLFCHFKVLVGYEWLDPQNGVKGPIQAHAHVFRATRPAFNKRSGRSPGRAEPSKSSCTRRAPLRTTGTQWGARKGWGRASEMERNRDMMNELRIKKGAGRVSRTQKPEFDVLEGQGGPFVHCTPKRRFCQPRCLPLLPSSASESWMPLTQWRSVVCHANVAGT